MLYLRMRIISTSISSFIIYLFSENHAKVLNGVKCLWSISVHSTTTVQLISSRPAGTGQIDGGQWIGVHWVECQAWVCVW
uniref:Secreted protein n=1 Tax=Pyxicephalus adspersus TaxID=30357 RepID=A0AAV2ZT16_PYXAD|nr:TPA: hypothetical protein GDO54_004157 [Pyxicephalus adspersus]